MTTDTTNLAEAPDRNLALELVRVTEAAAMAAARWVGFGDIVASAAVEGVLELLDKALNKPR